MNGYQIFKEYTTKLKEQSGATLKNYDEISRLEFKDFRSADGKLIAWIGWAFPDLKSRYRK